MKKKYYLNIITFFALLSFGYYYFFYFIQNFSNKIGFPLHLNFIKLLECAVVLLCVFMFYIKYNLNSSVYLSFSYILSIFILIPMSVFYWMSDGSRKYFYMNFLAFFILNMLYAFANKSNFGKWKNKKVYIKNKKIRYSYIFLSVILIFLIVDSIIYVKYGNSIFYLFHMNDVYDIRLKSRNIVPEKISYVISWSVNVIVPCLLAYCIKYKKYIMMIIPVIIQILLFTVGGNKSYIFGLALTVFIFILFKYKIMYWFLTFLNFVVAISLFINNKFIMAIVIRRTFFVPASTSFSYYEFFSNNPKMNLSSSIFSRLFENIYGLDSPFIISRYIYRAPKMSSNANYIANAYSNFGFWGIIIFTIILAALLLLIEKISLENVEKHYIVLIVFSSMFILTNSALLTTLKTHGLLFAIFMCYLFNGIITKKY